MENKAKVDFNNGRGFGAMGVGLAEDFLKGDPRTVLITIAALYGHADPLRANRYSMAMNMLSLYAAGAAIELTRAEYDMLREQVDEYMSIQSAPRHGHERNVEFARFVLTRAARRARSEKLA